MTNEYINKIIAAFILLIVGIVMLGVVATETNDRTTLTSATEQIDTMAANNGTGIDAAQTFTITLLGDTNADCLLTDYTFENSTGTDFTETTDYTLDTATGVFNLENTTFDRLAADNSTNVTYTYCPSGYISLGWGRTTTNLVPGFFALALMGIALWMFYGIARDWMGKT